MRWANFILTLIAIGYVAFLHVRLFSAERKISSVTESAELSNKQALLCLERFYTQEARISQLQDSREKLDADLKLIFSDLVKRIKAE